MFFPPRKEMNYLQLWNSGNYSGIFFPFYLFYLGYITDTATTFMGFKIMTDAQIDGLDSQVYLHAAFHATFI